MQRSNAATTLTYQSQSTKFHPSKYRILYNVIVKPVFLSTKTQRSNTSKKISRCIRTETSDAISIATYRPRYERDLTDPSPPKASGSEILRAAEQQRRANQSMDSSMRNPSEMKPVRASMHAKPEDAAAQHNESRRATKIRSGMTEIEMPQKRNQTREPQLIPHAMMSTTS
ncbi:hypothetical protein QQ045_003329 [Rhodiola kirilowii]